jgi:hypothetical protein
VYPDKRLEFFGVAYELNLAFAGPENCWKRLALREISNKYQRRVRHSELGKFILILG